MVGAELLRPLPDVGIQESRQAQVSIQSARLTPGGHILEIRGRDAHTQHSTGAGRLLDEGRPHAGTRSPLLGRQRQLRPGCGSPTAPDVSGKLPALPRRPAPELPIPSGAASGLPAGEPPEAGPEPGLPAGQPPPTTTVSSGAPVRERRQLGTPGACQDVTDAPGSGTVAQDSSDVL
ncbi:unnamed protein product, partial [Ixodes persulcatus]